MPKNRFATERYKAWLALSLMVSPLVVSVFLGWNARAARAAKRAEQPAIEALARRLPSADLALSGGARWLRAVSLEEPGAALSDGPAAPDPDPAGPAMAPPVDVWSAVRKASSAP